MYASYVTSSTCRAPFAAKHSAIAGMGGSGRSHLLGTRKSGGRGGRLRTGSGRRPGQRSTWTSMKGLRRRARTLSRTASSGALRMGRLAALKTNEGQKQQLPSGRCGP